MPTKWIPWVKALVHVGCLTPFVYLLEQYRSGAMGLMADPVNYITHFTGNWTVYMLLATLAVTPVRRLHPRLGNLVRFRRMLGLYAFFYATLHLGTYVFLFSGYDLPAAWAGLMAGHPGAVWTQWALIWPTILDDLVKRRFIQVGLLAWVILLALAVTSPAAVMRWMGGKRWAQLHSLVYVAAGAAMVHFWWLVKRGVRTPWKDTVVLGVLFGARIVWDLRKRRRAARRLEAPVGQ